ncbi:MAG: sarcosine oxidase subunit delta [Alphaproteobacteria bacterium]|nr:sarcosine oxidase subunit delta [Alphaproteobacteria bacterium]
MIRINCPYCGPRDHQEFAYVGDATLTRPSDDAGGDAWYDFVYLRDNPRGPHLEYWQHVHGCRAFVKVLRDTLTHEVLATGTAADDLAAGGR